MVRLIRSAKLGLLGVLLALAGCQGLHNGAQPLIQLRDGSVVMAQRNPGPGTSSRTSFDFKPVLDAIISDCLNVAPTQTQTPTDARRNRLVTAFMFGVDLGYNEYERNLLNSIRENDLGAAAASLALSSIGSVVGDQNIARALSTTNSIVTGTHTAIDRDYLMNQTLTVLQTQMRANRANQRAVIIRRMQLDYDQWNSCMALSDVLAYEQAGTLNGALAAVAANSADANRQGEQDADDAIMRASLSRDPLSRALRDFVYPPNQQNLWAARAQIVDGIIVQDRLMPSDTMPVPIRRTVILNFADPTRATERLALARAIVASDQVATELKGPLQRALAETR